jgi:hypothetical protein
MPGAYSGSQFISRGSAPHCARVKIAGWPAAWVVASGAAATVASAAVVPGSTRVSRTSRGVAPVSTLSLAWTPVAWPVQTGSVPPRVPVRAARSARSGSLSSVSVLFHAVHRPAPTRVRNRTLTAPTAGSVAQLTPTAEKPAVLGRLTVIGLVAVIRTPPSGTSVSLGRTGC